MTLWRVVIMLNFFIVITTKIICIILMTLWCIIITLNIFIVITVKIIFVVITTLWRIIKMLNFFYSYNGKNYLCSYNDTLAHTIITTA